MKVGHEVTREHGKLKLHGVILRGWPQPFARVDVTLNGDRLGQASSTVFVRTDEDAPMPMAMNRFICELAINFAKEMEHT